jgi:hypothetical protein
MAVAQASCPNCGAPLEFGLGSSWARVCDYCRHTVVRTDRGLQNMGQAAALANTPALVAVGDEGVLGGRPFRVFGRVQLDHGAGPWDEYYLGLDYGQSWGFLAYAQGEWYATALSSAVPVPPHEQLRLEQDVLLGAAGPFRVAEIKAARVVATEGEVPNGTREGMLRLYADCWGRGRGFATLDYGETGTSAALFLGYVLSEAELSVTQLGPRTAQKVKAQRLTCPNCGGDVPKLSGERSQRLGCPYCGAVSDIALRTVVAQQERLQQATTIPVGSRGTLDSTEYLCIAYLRRSTSFAGEPYRWEEYLLFSPGIGFRWLVKDPETGWSWVTPVNLAELDLSQADSRVAYRGRRYGLRNRNRARVDFVLGEVFWKCEVGETTDVCDYVAGQDVLSRESHGSLEVRWSTASPVPWPVLARAFNLPVDGPGAPVFASSGSEPPDTSQVSNALWVALIIIAFVLLACAAEYCGDDDGSSGGGVRFGGGVFSGGK